MIGVTCNSMPWSLGLDEVTKVLKREDSSDRLFVEDGEAFLFVGGPCLGYPSYYALGLFAQKEELALVFIRGSLICMLIKACPPAVIASVNFYEACPCSRCREVDPASGCVRGSMRGLNPILGSTWIRWERLLLCVSICGEERQPTRSRARIVPSVSLSLGRL
jgi:hypothetical protein